MWFMFNKYQVLFIVALAATYDLARCDAISNTNFNSHIRDFSTADINNITNVKTLQKEELGRYGTFALAGNPIKFKEIPDSALSSSSNGRGLLYHDQPGYALNDYEEAPHYPHGHDYHLYDAHPDVHGPHGFEHGPYGYEHEQHDHHNHHEHHDPHNPHDYDHHHYSGHHGHHLDPGHYNKHYKHALAAKTVLWPIAGIALLGAAAALVSNPVLLQLGVISGKRRRRDTEEITGPDFPSNTFTKYAEKIKKQSKDTIVIQPNESIRKITKQKDEKVKSLNEHFKRRVFKATNLNDSKLNVGIRSSVKKNVDQVTTYYPENYNGNKDEERFIPIPIKLRTPKVGI